MTLQKSGNMFPVMTMLGNPSMLGTTARPVHATPRAHCAMGGDAVGTLYLAVFEGIYRRRLSYIERDVIHHGTQKQEDT